MPTITGLTKRQVALLDTMWAIDGYEEYLQWKSAQPNRAEIDTLEELVLLAEIDDMIDAGEGTEVGDLLNRYRG